MSKIVCFGEVLWDVFPNGSKKIGGAPLNVALRLASFGDEVTMVSAVGKDSNGERLLQYINENGLDDTYIQTKDNFSTGEVTVILNDKGSASYEIEHPRAWDNIELSDALEKQVANSDAFVFGSLIVRDEVSKQTLYRLLDVSHYNIFDLNLRPPHYSKAVLIHLMEKADFIKFNDEELYEVADYLGSKYMGLEQNIKFIAVQTNTKHICVTKGAYGAVLFYDGRLYYNSGYKIKVADTVGAGDSFLGTLINQLLNNEDAQKAIDVACAVGALVAQSEGANPKLTMSDIDRFTNP
ncbi:carbohydrate kinase family protein [Hyunsoonleella ulvae]|uniref:carbohydrate kinase family protein n=1 Tax=Hyunsoonleella ulvae TaxID=2799948 RepID=UPI0019395EB0|nr:carbohydrate kinase [Hyunsoonleella ulvae]